MEQKKIKSVIKTRYEKSIEKSKKDKKNKKKIRAKLTFELRLLKTDERTNWQLFEGRQENLKAFDNVS